MLMHLKECDLLKHEWIGKDQSLFLSNVSSISECEKRWITLLFLLLLLIYFYSVVLMKYVSADFNSFQTRSTFCGKLHFPCCCIVFLTFFCLFVCFPLHSPPPWVEQPILSISAARTQWQVSSWLSSTTAVPWRVSQSQQQNTGKEPLDWFI